MFCIIGKYKIFEIILKHLSINTNKHYINNTHVFAV